MLRLTVTSRADPPTSTIVVEGRLVGDWASLLESECRTLLGRGLPVELDLQRVNDIDSLGAAVLHRLQQGRVRLIGLTPLLRSLLTEDHSP